MKILKKKHISIIGGAGHVGLPLGLAFAAKKYKVHLIDKNEKYLNLIKEKFGQNAVDNIKSTTGIKLKRKLLGD